MQKPRYGKQIIVALLGACLLGSLTANYAVGDERSNLEEKRKAAAQKVKQTKNALEGVNKNLAEAVVKLAETKKKQADAEISLADANTKMAESQREQAQITNELALAQSKLADLNKQIKQSVKQADSNRREIGQVAREIYTQQANLGAVNFIFGKATAADLANYARNTSLAVRLQKQSLDKVTNDLVTQRNAEDEQQALTEKVQNLKAAADTALEKAAQVQKQRANALSEIKTLADQEKQLKNELDEKKAELAAFLANAKKKEAEFRAQIQKIDEENRRKALYGTAGGGVSTAGFVSGSIFQAPIRGALHVNSPFGWRVDPVTGRNTFLHTGVDLYSPCMNPQYAAADGYVFKAGWGFGGNEVHINHGLINGASWQTVYAHLHNFAVHTGQRVKKGQLIGYTGTTGWSTGCHCHFEIWRNGVVQNPLPYLNK